MREFVLLVLLVVALGNRSQGQSTSGNADFENGNFTNWSGFTGTCCPIVTPGAGIVQGRHTIMGAVGTDPHTNNVVSYIAPDGGSYSARLGNDAAGAEADRLSYTFTVDSTSNLFIYRYAVVFEDPNHSPAEQPRFDIVVFDQNGQVVNCGTYSVVSGPANSGFVRNTIDTGIVFKDWTSVGIDLSPYMGTQITITFSVGDCQIGGHFGYAYLDCYYTTLDIITDFCPGSPVASLNAPEGFAAYQWSTGATTKDITINNPQPGASYSCTLTAVTGCTVTVNTVLAPALVDAAFSVLNRCQNVAEFGNMSQVISGPPIVSWLWIFGDGDSASVNHNFTPSVQHAYQSPGTYNVSLVVQNAVGCTDQITIPVNILPNPTAGLSGFSAGCSGDPVIFTDSSQSNGAPLSQWNWNFANGITNGNGSSVQHVFENPGAHHLQYTVVDTNGCYDRLDTLIATSGGTAAGFSYGSICGTPTIQFNDSTQSFSTNISSITWNFGDGSPPLTGLVTDPLHTFPNYGTYTIEQIVTSATGCTDTFRFDIIIPRIIQADFISSPLVCTGSTVYFSNSSIISDSGFVRYLQWDFGDGNQWPSLTENNPTHVYNVPGPYTIRLVITTNDWCTDTVWHSINVIGPNAVYNIDGVCPGDMAIVNAQIISALAPVVSQTWDFGDGSGQIPGPVTGHVFLNPGTYYVTLTLLDSVGCTNVIRDTVETAPVPVAYSPATQTCTGSLSNFTSLSTISSGNIILHQWEFGDGSPMDTGVTVSHSYLQPGNFRLSLFVESDRGCRDSIYKELTLYEPPIADFETDTVCAGGTITCFDLSVDNNGGISDWTWILGDTGQIVYSQGIAQGSVPLQGPFVVTLIVKSAVGCSDTIQKSPYVIPAPVANFIFSTTCDGDSMEFTNASQLQLGPSYKWQWDYGDGDTSSRFNAPAHLYSTWGSYPVLLTVYDSSISGCFSSILKDVIVYANPVASIKAVPPYCAIYEVAWRDSSWVPDNSPIRFWNWKFGNGDSSTLQNPITIYKDGGLYDIELTVETIYGCKGNISLPGFMKVFPELTANFFISPDNPSVYQPEVHFYNTSVGANQLHWMFGDGSSSTIENPIHVFQQAGEYLATLVVKSDSGCIDTITRKIDVRNDYSLFIPDAFSPNGDGINETFKPKAFNTSGFKMEIYDRWGALVFRTDNIELGWDGTYMGIDAPQDVYVYRIKYVDAFYREKIGVGKMALIR